MKIKTLFVLFQIFLIIEKVPAKTLFRDERLYPAVKDFENNFLSLVLSYSITSFQEIRVIETINSAIKLLPSCNKLEYDVIKSFSANFAFSAVQKFNEEHRNKTITSCSSTELFRIILQAFKKAGKIIEDVSRVNVFTDRNSLDAEAPEQQLTASNSLHDYDLLRSFPSLLKDRVFVESSDITLPRSKSNHVVSKGFMRTLPGVVNKTVKSSKMYANSINSDRNIAVFSDDLHRHLESSKLFNLVFRNHLPVDLAKVYTICFAASLSNVKEFNLFDVSDVVYFFEEDIHTITKNNTTKFYSRLFSNKISKFLSSNVQIQPSFKFFDSSLSKNILNSFSNHFFHVCETENLEIYTSTEKVQYSNKFIEPFLNEHFSQFQLEFSYRVSLELVKFSDTYNNSDKHFVILALESTLDNLFNTFSLSDSLFHSAFDKSFLLFKEYSCPTEFLTFIVLDITRTLSNIVNFHEFDSKIRSSLFTKTFIQNFRERLITIKNHVSDQGDQNLVNRERKDLHHNKSHSDENSQKKFDSFSLVHLQRDIHNAQMRQHEDSYKKWIGTPLLFAKRIYHSLLSSKLFKHAFHFKSKQISRFCAFVITYHLSDIIDFDITKMSSLADLFTELLWSDKMTKEIYAQIVAVQLTFWFDLNGIFLEHDVLPFSSLFVDSVLKDIESCNLLEPDYAQHGHHIHKREVAFSIQIDNETLIPPVLSNSPEFPQKYINPVMKVEIPTNKIMVRSQNVKKKMNSVQTNDSEFSTPLKDSLKSLLYYNLMSSSVFKEVMHDNLNSSCANIYAQEIAHSLLKSSPWTNLNESSIINGILQDFPSKKEKQTSAYYANILARRISDLAEKNSLIEKNRLNEVATATANSITSYLTKRVYSEKNLCQLDTDLIFTNNTISEKQFADTSPNNSNYKQDFKYQTNSVNHTLISISRSKINNTFPKKELNSPLDYEKNNTNDNLTDTLPLLFANILQKNLLISDIFVKAFYDGLPFPVASAYAFSMAKSLASCPELKVIDKSEFSVAFETALNAIGNKSSLQLYSEIFSSQISKLLGRKGFLEETTMEEKADIIANEMIRGLPIETLSPDPSSFSQNLGKDISMKNRIEEMRYLKDDKSVRDETSVTRNQIEFSKSFRNHLKNCTNLTSTFYTGFPRDKAMRYFFEIEDIFINKLNLSKPLVSLFNQNLERDIKLLNEYPKTEDYINFLIMKITWLFTSCGIINEIESTKLSKIAVNVILLALYRERPDVDYCLEYGMAHEKGNVLILGELLCHELISSKSFENSFRSITPREIAAAYVFSMAESLLKDFKFVPESAMSVAFVKGMFAVKQNPSTKKYAAAFAYEIAHVFDSYDALSWSKIRENVKYISDAMLSGLPADISSKSEKFSSFSMHRRTQSNNPSSASPDTIENFTFIKNLENELISSELFNKTFNTSVSSQESFELAELISMIVTNVSESNIFANLAYALPYYAAFRNQRINPPVDYAHAISMVSFELLKELNGLTGNEALIAREKANAIVNVLTERNQHKNLQNLENCSDLLTHLTELRKNESVTKKLKKKIVEVCSKVISELVYYNFVSSKLFQQFFLSIRYTKYNSNVMNRLTNCITNSSMSSIIEMKSRKESVMNALKIAKYNITIEVFAHSLSNETTLMKLDSNSSDIKGVIPTATSLSNIVMICISGLRRKEKSHAGKYQNSHYPRTSNNTFAKFQLDQVDLNFENSTTYHEPNSNDSLSILNNDFNSSTDAEALEILKLLRSNQELLSLPSQSLQTSLLIFNTKEKDAMRIEKLKKEKSIVLFYRFLLYNLRTSRAFQSNLLQDLKQAPLKSLVLALSKYIVNIPDFSSISEQHIFQTYNTSLHSLEDEIEPMKLAIELSLTTTNLLLYYDVLDSSKLISQAALASIAINKAIFYVHGKVNGKHNLNAVERTKQIDRIIDTKRSALKSETSIFGEKSLEKGNNGSEELLFNEILFSGLSSSRLFSKVFNSDLTNDSATECFPQLAKQLSKVMKNCFIRRKYMNLYQNIIILTQRKANITDYVKIFTHFFYQILKFSDCAESKILSYQAFDMFNALSIGLSRCLQLKDRISSKKYILADNDQVTITFENFLFNFCSSSQNFCKVFNPWLSQTHAQSYGRAMAKSVFKAHMFSSVLKKFLIYTYIKELKKIESVSCPVYAKMFSVHTTNVLRKYLIGSRAVFQASVTFAAMSKGIQTINHRLSRDYSMPVSNVTSFNLFWDNFGEVDELRSNSNNTSTSVTALKEKENKALSSMFTKLLNYNLMSSKIFIRSFNNNTTNARASKCAFVIANSINDVINNISINTDLIQAFDIILHKLPGQVSTQTYASIFSSTISDIFGLKDILISTKLQPLSVNVSYAINAALFKVSSMTTFQRKFVHKTESEELTKPILLIQERNKLNQVKMENSQQVSSKESKDFSSGTLFEESLKHFLLSSNIASKYLRIQQQCSESRMYANKMAEFVKQLSEINDLNTFQSLIESYDAILSSVNGKENEEEFVQRIANVTTKLLIQQNFLDPYRLISQAALTSNVLHSALSANVSLQCSNDSHKNISNTNVNASEIISDADIFGKALHYNLKSFVEYFLKSSCKNFTDIYAEEMGKSLIRLVQKIDSQDDFLLIELLKKSLNLQESDNFLMNISSLIASFLKLRNFLDSGRVINQAVAISHILKKAVLRAAIKIHSISKNLCLEKSRIPTKIIFKESLEHNLLSSKIFVTFFGEEKELSNFKMCTSEMSKSLSSLINMKPGEFFLLKKSLTNILLQIRSMKNVRLYAQVIALITAILFEEHNAFVRNRVIVQAAFTNYVLINSIFQCFQNKTISLIPVSEAVKIRSLKLNSVQKKNALKKTTENLNNPSHKNIKSSLHPEEQYFGNNNTEQNIGLKKTTNRSNQTFFEECLVYNLLSSNIKNKIIELQSKCGDSSFQAFKISKSIAELTEMNSSSTQTLAKEFKKLLSPKYESRNRDQLVHEIASVTSKILKTQRYLNSSKLIAQAAITANAITRSIINASIGCARSNKNEQENISIDKIRLTSSELTTFKKYLLYNLKTQMPLTYFLETASNKEALMLAKAISKSVMGVLWKTQNQDDNSLSLSLKEAFTREKAKPFSHSYVLTTLSVITSFLKEKNYLVDERLVTQAAIVSNALNKGILIAILKPNSFSKSLSIKLSEPSTGRVFQKSLEHNLKSSKIFKDFFCHKKEISDLKNCAPEISQSMKFIINITSDKMEMFQEALKNLLLQVKAMGSIEIYARAISTAVTCLFENQNALEKNRVVLQAASTGSALLEGINRVSRKLHLKKHYHHLESSIYAGSTDCQESLRIKFESALRYNMQSSKIFNILKYTRTATEIDSYVEEMSRSVANLINKRELMIESLEAKYRNILNFPERNKSLESYVTAISSTTTTFLCSQNFLVPHRLTADATIVSNSLHSSIVKALRKCVKNSLNSDFLTRTAIVLPVDKKFKCYLLFREILHYNLVSFSSCKNVFSTYYLNYVNTKNADFTANIALVIAELTNMDITKTLELTYTLRDILRSFPLKINLNPIFYVTSSIIAKEFCQNKEIEFSRLVYETMSISKLLCDKVKKALYYDYKTIFNFSVFENDTNNLNNEIQNDLVNNAFEKSLYDSLSPILQTFYLCECHQNQLSQLAHYLSEVVFGLNESDSSKRISLVRIIVEELSITNNKCSKLNVRNLALRMAHFVKKENILRNNVRNSPIPNFRNYFKKAIEKAKINFGDLSSDAKSFPSNDIRTKDRFNYCQTANLNNEYLSYNATEIRVKNSHLICERFIDSSTYSAEDRYIKLIYENLISSGIFKSTFKPGTSKEKAFHSATSIAVAVIDSKKCNTANEAMLERFFKNAILFLPPNHKTEDFACSISLTTSMACYEPNHEKDISLNATVISNSIRENLNSNFLKT